MSLLKTALNPTLGVPQGAKARALERIDMSTPVEEEGFKFYSLPFEF